MINLDNAMLLTISGIKYGILFYHKQLYSWKIYAGIIFGHIRIQMC